MTARELIAILEREPDRTVLIAVQPVHPLALEVRSVKVNGDDVWVVAGASRKSNPFAPPTLYED